MRINFIFMMVILIFSSFCYAGQYYKFTDANGVVSFTDDISKIPIEQRAEIEVNKAMKSNQVVPQNKTSENKLSVSDSEKPKELDSEAEELKKIKADLDKESEEINKETIQLIEEGKNVKDNDNVDAYNIKVTQLNEKTKALQLKQLEYMNRVNKYNTKQQN